MGKVAWAVALFLVACAAGVQKIEQPPPNPMLPPPAPNPDAQYMVLEEPVAKWVDWVKDVPECLDVPWKSVYDIAWVLANTAARNDWHNGEGSACKMGSIGCFRKGGDSAPDTVYLWVRYAADATLIRHEYEHYMGADHRHPKFFTCERLPDGETP